MIELGFKVSLEGKRPEYVNKEKDDELHAVTIHQASVVDHPADSTFPPKYTLTPTTNDATITECDWGSIKLEYQEI